MVAGQLILRKVEKGFEEDLGKLMERTVET